MAKQLKTSYEINWKCMPLLGGVSRGTFISSCLHMTGKNASNIHPLFKINLITYTQKGARNLLTVAGKLEDTVECASEQLGGGRMGFMSEKVEMVFYHHISYSCVLTCKWEVSVHASDLQLRHQYTDKKANSLSRVSFYALKIHFSNRFRTSIIWL